MGQPPCWPTSHHSARDSSTTTWRSGRCVHNVCIDEKRPLLANTLIKCVGCGRCTCIDCLDRLATLASKTVAEHESVGLVFQRTEELEALLSGKLGTAPEDPGTGALASAHSHRPHTTQATHMLGSACAWSSLAFATLHQPPPSTLHLPPSTLHPPLALRIGAIVAKRVDRCIFCPDKSIPALAPAVEPQAMLAEMDIDATATFKDSAPCLIAQHTRC